MSWEVAVDAREEVCDPAKRREVVLPDASESWAAVMAEELMRGGVTGAKKPNLSELDGDPA